MRIKGLTAAAAWQAVRAGLRGLPAGGKLYLCVADHFEPDWRGADRAAQAERVRRWIDGYPRLAADFRDDRGQAPQHSWFFPAECYEPWQLDQLARLVHDGWGEVEVHLHHHDDSADGLRSLLLQHAERLFHRHGLLTRDAAGQIRYGFIHGNWALANSHPEGRHCGVNAELTVLRETGCYADFTMPSAPHPTQTRTINSVYYADDRDGRPKGHDRGQRSRVGQAAPAHKLLLIQGPLVGYAEATRRGLRPRLETGDLTHRRPPTLERLARWVQARVQVAGRDDWWFVKLHTHGAQEANAAMLLGQPMRDFHASLRPWAADNGFEFYYVTARELAGLVRQAECGAAAPDWSALAPVPSRSHVG